MSNPNPTPAQLAAVAQALKQADIDAGRAAFNDYAYQRSAQWHCYAIAAYLAA